jgi:hypothetical protein
MKGVVFNLSFATNCLKQILKGYLQVRFPSRAGKMIGYTDDQM